MNTSSTFHKECLVYPGEYIPLPAIEALLLELKSTGKESDIKPLVNMVELKNGFKVEVALPGIKREDIFIYAENNVLNIIVFHKNSEELKLKLQIHEFDTEFLERHLILPADADTEFVCAEYDHGILRLHIPKKQVHSINNSSQIVVY